ncbi:TDE2712 family protein [Isachenkonia alkalipeptolytica]|uniref:Uncharacterized protein n=1 Tax=Isachenkonia alkalipeptolytica TaxID=2565777 RepID=A0AA43XL20_9CLOT|nr:hypothetical protein [Isachenkonia alkalipeptolytica]NBG88682.1 hypothetical protein [Isachenkonia alkalipeptolytica]
MKRIKIKLDIVESMLYYWQATSEKEKVGEGYLNDIASHEDMKKIYDSEFDQESFRKVLSAISNREPFQSDVKKERVFWNANMWMTEDMEFTQMMVGPIKVLNLDDLLPKIKEGVQNPKYEEVEVVFLPGHEFEYQIHENQLLINFFRVQVDLYEEDKVEIGGTPLKEYLREKIIEVQNQN